MKKAKTLVTKFRSAIRLIWSRSAERKAIITQSLDENKEFTCPMCKKKWGAWAADVDHDPGVGSLESIDQLVDYTKRMFYGHQRLLCKPCHKVRTALQRRKPK